MTDLIDTTTRTEYPATVSIDGGALLPADLTIVTRTTWLGGSANPSTDPSWEFTDGAGHWHGFTEDGGFLPTLDRDGEVTWCRGRQCGNADCPGYHVPAYTCKICAELVIPRFGPPPAEAIAIPAVGYWFAVVDHRITPDPVRVQAIFHLPDGTVLIGAGSTITKPGQITGIGDLATRGAAGLRPLTFHQVSNP